MISLLKENDAARACYRCYHYGRGDYRHESLLVLLLREKWCCESLLVSLFDGHGAREPTDNTFGREYYKLREPIGIIFEEAYWSCKSLLPRY